MPDFPLILVLKDGRIVERGTHEELLSRNGFYRQLYRIQFQDQEGSPAQAGQQQAVLTTTPLIIEENTVTKDRVDGHKKASRLKSSDDVVFGKPYDLSVVSRIAGYFSAFRVVLPLTIVSTLLYTFTTTASPYLVGIAENNYIVAGNLGGLNIIVAMFMANAILFLIAFYAQFRAEAKLGQSVLLT